MRDSQLHGRERLRRLREGHQATSEEMAAERARFQRLAREDSAPRVVSAFNLFQTPETLAEQLAGMFPEFGRTLEPSAGLGRLYLAVRRRNRDCEIVLVDESPECCGELYRATESDSAAKLIQADFLTLGEARLGRFDSIIMNPPFKMGRDIKHITHAATLLNKGGFLASLCANGPRQREQLKPIAAGWIDLPPGSFKESFTNVDAAIVIIEA